MARYLVTGGVGFIGYHVTRALLGRGDEVAVVDDFSDAPYPRAEKERNARDLRAASARVTIAHASVTDADQLAPLVAARPDAIVHLAGVAGVRPSFQDPARYAKVNVEGTARVVQLARAHGVQRIVMASSSSVYGDATPLPAREDAPAVSPESPYAASKRGAELVAEALAKHTPGLACASLRFFTVYGPRQRPEMAIMRFVRAVVDGRPLTMFGDGSMKRDVTHVDDIARGILAALERAPAGFRAYNLGAASPVELRELVRAIGEAAGAPPLVEYAPVPPGDVRTTFADITRARTELGWSPLVTLEEGLSSVVEWVREHPSRE
jgi:UDP-glucuronate 4-epimerase